MDHIDISNDHSVTAVPLTTLRIRVDYASSPRGAGTPGEQQPRQRPTALGCIIPPRQWLPDDQTSVCMASECQQPFSLFHRKHHCRVCGNIFCASCSAKTIAAVHVAPGGSLVHAASVPDTSSPIAAAAAAATGAGGFSAAHHRIASPTASEPPQRSPRMLHSASAGGNLASHGNQLVGQVQTVRVCNECFFAHQLAIAKRPPRLNGIPRRRCRGVMKMFQYAQLVLIASFLSVRDLNNLALTASDFYFATRDNQVWFLISASRQWRHHGNTTPAITLQHFHSRFSNTHFLSYLHKLEVERFAGLSSFAASAKLLISGGIKIAVIGPSAVGKTLLVKRFVGDTGNDVVVNRHSTVGFVTYMKRVALTGGLGGEATLTLFDLGGDARYDAMRTLFCASSHCIVLCYNVSSKLSLVQAALQMQVVEPHLKEQPVVVCGLSTDSRPREVTESEAEAASIRSKASIQTNLAGAAAALETAVEATLNTLRRKGSLGVPDPTPLDVLLSV